MSHLRNLATQKDAEVAHVCDPDEKRLAAAADEAGKVFGRAPKLVKDLRRVFEDRAVDAVMIATPDHWHVPAS